MPVIRIMNWNVQNFGKTKSELCPDVVRAIAQIVGDMNIDIFVMLEVNTKSAVDANTIATTMRDALRAYEGGGTWDVCVLSPNTGLEFYAYFVRNTAVTRPLTIYGPPSPWDGSVPKGIGGVFDHCPPNVAQFRDAGGSGVIAPWFPLIRPDLGYLLQSGRAQANPPAWLSRYPAFGLFWLPGATAPNQLLPVIACHYHPDHNAARQQFNMMQYFSPLRALAPGPAHPNVPNPFQLQVHPPGGVLGPHTPTGYVLLGDFNVDWLAHPGDYAGLTNGLGATGWVGATTHYVTYANYSPRDYHTTTQLLVNAYDNFFTRTPPAVAPAYVGRYSVAEHVRTRDIKLNEGVKHYRENDQRGFDKAEYQNLVYDYATQLTNKSGDINLTGSLVGARLISDHIPVVMSVTVP